MVRGRYPRSLERSSSEIGRFRSFSVGAVALSDNVSPTPGQAQGGPKPTPVSVMSFGMSCSLVGYLQDPENRGTA